MKKKAVFAGGLLMGMVSTAQVIITENQREASFTITSTASAVSIYTDETDHILVQKAALFLQNDIKKVTGKEAGIIHQISSSPKEIIIIGSFDKSAIIQQLVRENKLNGALIRGKWEGFVIQLINNPVKGIEKALVIAGSDRRGTAYGVFEISRQIGVSPWYWWADVPVKKKSNIFIKKEVVISDAPKVKYRGIFINDEAPALSGWTKEKFGGFNHLFYEKVFELILRLKGNYLWPAMWGNAFYDDDSLNTRSADDFGIVIGTSHHEPLMRAHDEWRRYGKGIWDYDSNAVRLKEFWRMGMQRASNEKIVSIGMRGDGDKPMSAQTATALLERIVKDQRQIIEEVTGRPAGETPQLWALYKEVQDYYDKGMRVPDDVTLLLCDDNWGNIRKLPKLNEGPRKGGYGIYYHFDYVGGPRNYKWLNTNNIARVWEQMHLAYEYNVGQIWIANVGDIKPMEFPISFFLDYAWDPDKWNEDNLRTYYTNWATQQFGPAHAKEIGYIIQKYSQYNARRKPELLDANTYSLFNYEEAYKVVDDYKKLLTKAEKINDALPPEYRDAFFELVLHPVKASANLNELYVAVAWNRSYAAKSLGAANEYADRAKQLYTNDSLISMQFNSIANGKWNHMMDQTHIGYTYWQQPPVNKMPEVKYLPRNALVDSGLIINSITESAKYLTPKNINGKIFYELSNYVSIEAAHYTKAVSAENINWKVIPDIGRDGDGISTFPVTANEQRVASGGPHLEYDIYVYDTGTVKLQVCFSPTLNFHNNEGLKYAVSIDDEIPQVISINKDDNDVRTWEKWVANNIIIKTSVHHIARPGKHLLKYWVVSPAVVLQKLVMDFGGVKASYLGPPETRVK